jgi:hypothetical protein
MVRLERAADRYQERPGDQNGEGERELISSRVLQVAELRDARSLFLAQASPACWASHSSGSASAAAASSRPSSW